jgi:hypothetical protein
MSEYKRKREMHGYPDKTEAELNEEDAISAEDHDSSLELVREGNTQQTYEEEFEIVRRMRERRAKFRREFYGC